jgi:hypothetical protein
MLLLSYLALGHIRFGMSKGALLDEAQRGFVLLVNIN